MTLSAAPCDAEELSPDERLGAQFAALEELAGQRNAIDGRIVDIVAAIERERSCIEEFPRCTEQLRQGQLSADQVGVIAQHAGAGSDEHYAQLASVATVSQLRFAAKLEPRPEPERPAPAPEPSLSKTVGEQFTTYRITLPALEAAKFDAALQSHRDALINEHTRDHGPDTDADTHERRQRLGDLRRQPPFPTLGDAFMRLVHTGWDTEATRRPHGQDTTVIVH
ncbi:DUF222 domain-containing protein, partial [Mycobacterium neumannii]|uniref:DUF222 domain-containing protein n=1 Tax=Mycobacterium neumannii TaxID=2048551 RepID=UPI003AB5DADA